MPCFLKIVWGLGKKILSEDEDFMACYSRIIASNKGSIAKDDYSNVDTLEENPASGEC